MEPINLSNLTPDQLISLKSQLDSITDTTGRTPIRPRQLHDLRLMPTATDARPMFIWSAESPRDGGDLSKTYEFPKLMWHADTGVEITVRSHEEQEEKRATYVFTPPTHTVVNPVDVLGDALADLTDQEREFVLKAQQEQRVKALQDRIANLSEGQLTELLAKADKQAKRTKKTA